ncbi:MAG: GNAT family N-acetyltransferase [Gemmatimonadetes bacterium]|nr:GNAT family N-acetyltransferase [Gemmatimonadota bacterium]
MSAMPRATRATDLGGPLQVASADIPELNRVFSEAFTERYRRDGLMGVRVPPLNPAIWEYAIAGAGDGAMLWRDREGTIAAFNLAHASGTEGWMGPLAVREDYQGAGIGKAIVRAGIAHLQSKGCRTIGLETMPRTVDNIGFYGGLGFSPGPLTVTVTLDAAAGTGVAGLWSAMSASERDTTITGCRALADRLSAGADFTNEILLTHSLALGDTVVDASQGSVRGFAVCHAAPLIEGRSREELRVLKLVAADEASFAELLGRLRMLARRCATVRATIRMQGEFRSAFRRAIEAGARVRWTDLRMTLDGYPEPPNRPGVVLSNWEI